VCALHERREVACQPGERGREQGELLDGREDAVALGLVGDGGRNVFGPGLEEALDGFVQCR
jgi:hypothetical protein